MANSGKLQNLPLYKICKKYPKLVIWYRVTKYLLSFSKVEVLQV